jgi:16S rRNA (uracil1498-N3)-methyltransferase
MNVLVSAIKQSANPFLPKLNEMINFNTFINSCKTFEGQKFICHCQTTKKTLLAKAYTAKCDVLICIGPEGDFTSAEIDIALSNNFMPASLGSFRFRTETAGINACMVINTINQISE